MSKVLIADDDAAVRKLYEIELKGKGYDVETAENGEEALRHVTSAKPDIILLDVMMPQKDGITTLKALKAHPTLATIPVIMLTNFGQEDIVKDALSSGATDYLLKYKITPSEMADKISQILSPTGVQF